MVLNPIKNKLLFLYFILLFWKISAISQNKKQPINIDSLYQIEIIKSDTETKVDKLIYLYKKSTKQKIRKDILEEALRIAKEIYYIKGIGICYNRKGITARYEQKYEESVVNHKRALSYLEKTTDTFHIGKCLNSLGVTYRKLNLEKEAFEAYLRALKLAEKIKNTRGISISLNGIGNVFLNTEQYDKSLRYLQQALQIEFEQKNLKGQEYGYANIGEIYLAKKNYDSAYFYFKKSLDLSLKNPRKENIAIKRILFGKLYQEKGMYQKSLHEYQKAIPKLEEYKNSRYLGKAYINMGITELYLNHYKQAKQYINKGLILAKKINSKENITLAYEALVEYYSKTNNYKEALEAHKAARIFHDSIVNITSQRSMINTQVAYETEEKDEKIHQLAIEKKHSEVIAKNNFKRFVITGILGLFSIVVLLIFFYLYRKNSDLELQQKNTEIKNYLVKITELKNIKNTSLNLEKYNLSKREIEVLTHISNGLKNEEISKKMFVSKNTIKTHITHIYAKLDVKNRIQAVRKIQ